MTRWKAALIHLGLSVVVVVGVVVSLMLLWYPPALFRIAGMDRLVMILGIIDIVVGPLLTLIVFRPGKPGLKFDLTVIALLQAAFLGYGLHVLAKARPVFIVAAVDRLELVRGNELHPDDLARGRKPEYRTLAWDGPRLVGVRMPRGAGFELAMEAMAGRDVHLRPELYVDYAESAPALLAHARPLADLRARSAADAAAIDRALASLKRDEASLRFVPITSRRADQAATMLVDATTGTPVKPLALNPWLDTPSE